MLRFLASPLALLILASTVTQAQAPLSRPTAEIVATARSVIEVPASHASMRFSVRNSAATPALAGERNAVMATRLRRALLALGVHGDSIVTRRIAASLRVDTETRDTSYIAENSVSVTTRRLDLVPRIIDTTLIVGVSEVSGLEYGADNLEEHYLETLRSATSKARRRAEVIALAAGGSLGRLLSSAVGTTTLGYERILDSPNSISMVSSTRVRTSIPIQAPLVQVAGELTMRFEFNPAP